MLACLMHVILHGGCNNASQRGTVCEAFCVGSKLPADGGDGGRASSQWKCNCIWGDCKVYQIDAINTDLDLTYLEAILGAIGCEILFEIKF